MVGEIKDYPCSYGTKEESIVGVVKACNLTVPEVYKDGEQMAELARAVKRTTNDGVVYLPFDHAVEAEALGAVVNYGSETVGPRTSGYICDKLEEILDLGTLDTKKGRPAQVLNACRILAEQGETVVLEVVGPITILNGLIDLRAVFKGMRKNPELMEKVFRKIEDDLSSYMRAAVAAGVKIISYGDAVATVPIMGPRVLKNYTEMNVLPFLRRMESELEHKALILLCPKTAYALEGTESASYKPLGMPQGTHPTYEDGWLFAIGKFGFMGQMCIKAGKRRVPAEKLYGIILKDEGDEDHEQ